MSDYLEQISAYICRSQFKDFPSYVVQRARDVVADSLAVIAAGAQEDEIQDLVRRIADADHKQAATVIGAGIRVEPSKAALINGTAGTCLELDEGNHFARGHPAIQVIPAALAVAEEMNISGSELLSALVLGYEVSARIGIACKLRISMHPHGTWGTVGAAVAVGKLMGYEEGAMREIINVSSSLGLATSRRAMLEGGTVRNVYSGVSGYMGILAHDLVQSGFTGEADGLRTVFGSVVSETFVPEEMTKDLGHRFEIARNYFKKYACGRYCHSTLDAVEQILAQRPGGRIEPDEIADVEVKTYSWGAQLCAQELRTTMAAKFSTPFAVATFIVHGSGGIESFKSSAIHDPAVKSLAQRITVSEDPELTAMWPERRPSRVKITFTDGTVLEAQSLTNKGDSEDPFRPEELRGKFFELAEQIWKREVAEAIYDDAMKLDTLDNVNLMTARMI